MSDEAAQSVKTGLCRNCLAPTSGKKRCPACKSTRVISHPELASLSIAHIDCDAFYAAIEKRENPELATRPLIIGGGRRGVVATCCYIARTYGVHSAMPMFQARKLCPKAVVLPPRMSFYSEEGKKVKAMMKELTPLVESVSIDEAFLDLSGTERLHRGPPARTLAKLALRVEKELGITVSIGLSYNKFLAKHASDLEKPRGFSVIGQEEALEFLKPRPVSMIFGVGAALAKKLKSDGIQKIADLQRIDEEELVKRYGKIGTRLYNFSRGQDSRPVNPKSPVKSISNETTFDEDIYKPERLSKILWPLTEKVSERLKMKELKGRTITLKLKTSRFRTITRNKTLNAPTHYAETIFETGEEMLKAVARGDAFRLIGIGVSEFEKDTNPELTMDFTGDTEKRKLLAEEALDVVRRHFGKDAIKRGRDLNRI